MAEDETDGAPKLPPDARLETLDRRLDQLRHAEAKKQARAGGDPSYRIGQLILSHLVGAPAGGFIIGFVLDKLFGTRPWLMLLFLFLGFGVGLRNVLRIAKSSSGSPGIEK
jgi:ATP synthase protein I